MSDILRKLRALADKAGDPDAAKHPITAWTIHEQAFVLFHLHDLVSVVESVIEERRAQWVKAEEGTPEYEQEIDAIAQAFMRTEKALMNLGVEREDE